MDLDLILALDTATAFAGIALWTPYRVLAEEIWLSNRNHTVELMPSVMRILERQGLSPTDLTGVAVTQGPGSFTGMRIGFSLAKGMALSLSIPLIAVPTLEVLAHGQSARYLPVRAVLQAGRGRLCWADFRWHHRRWHQQDEVVLGSVEDIVTGVHERTLFCGELEGDEIKFIQESLGPTAVIASPAEGLRRASYLAELAYRRLARGEAEQPSVSPLYLQPGGGVSA